MDKNTYLQESGFTFKVIDGAGVIESSFLSPAHSRSVEGQASLVTHPIALTERLMMALHTLYH